MAAFDFIMPADRMALVHIVRSLGSFDHGAEDLNALEALANQFRSRGFHIPNRIPVSLAIKKMVKEQVTVPPLQAPSAEDKSASAELLRLAIADPTRAARTVAATANRNDPVAVARAWAAGAPDNGFAPAVAGLDAAQWREIVRALVGTKEEARQPWKSQLAILVGFWATTAAHAALAEAPPESALDVGVDEKLGQTIPLDIKLVDEQGDRVSLRDLIDKPTLLTLNYFRCVGLCTPLLNGVAEMLQRIDQIPGKDFQVLTVSFDPRDDAELAGHKKENYIKQLGPAFRRRHGDFSPAILSRPSNWPTRLASSLPNPAKTLFTRASSWCYPDRHGDTLPLRVTFLPFDVKMAVTRLRRVAPAPHRPPAQVLLQLRPGRPALFARHHAVSAAFTIVLAVGFGVVVGVTRKRRRKSDPKESS